MNKSQNSPSASGVEPTPAEPETDYGSRPLAADRDRNGESRMDDGADFAGYTLLSRSPAPQGRRSLFRR